MAKPNFFLVGPPKCATTSLYHYLKQHPEIFLSETKETHFFDLEYSRGIDFYEQANFSGVGKEKAIGEATATYAFLPFAAERIKKHYPDAKLIFSLRDPVDRAFSEWLMHQSIGREALSFRDAIIKNEQELNTTCLEGEEGAGSYVERCQLMKDKLMQSYRVYIQSGLYGKQLEKYYSLFREEQILVIHYEDLRKNNHAVLRNIFSFLGVDESYTVPDVSVKNPYSYAKKYKKLFFSTVGRENTQRLLHIIPRVVRKQIKEYLRHKKVKKPVITEEDRLYANRFFHEDNILLEQIWGKSF